MAWEPSIKEITEAGSIGVTVLIVLYMAYRDKMHERKEIRDNTTMNNHLDHVHTALGKFSSLMEEMGRTTDRNTSILERLERVLDK